jgi:carbamoyltransferase
LNTDVDTAEKILNWDRMQSKVKTLGREVMAATVQRFLENKMLSYAQRAIERTGIRHLCLSGGVAANVVANFKIFEKVSTDLFIVPAMADDGTCQGAAILQMLEQGFSYEDLNWLRDRHMPYYGTRYSSEEVGRQLASFDSVINRRFIGESWPAQVARMVVEGQVGAIFHGRMEWGPRALGNRSIIADPRQANIREVLNANIKRRQAFQPFCPSILEEDRERLFEESYSNKHMTCAFRMKDYFAQQLPGAVHFDGTARVQFVEEADNPLYYRLLLEVKHLTGIGCLINTSFNRHGRTIVETPKDAVTDFLDTGLTFLLIEGWLVTRKWS